jgi:hypothetical protein
MSCGGIASLFCNAKLRKAENIFFSYEDGKKFSKERFAMHSPINCQGKGVGMKGRSLLESDVRFLSY